MDADYLDVLEDIDAGGYDVSAWEAEFIEHLLTHRPHILSEKQQAVIKRMAEKYLGEVLE